MLEPGLIYYLNKRRDFKKSQKTKELEVANCGKKYTGKPMVGEN